MIKVVLCGPPHAGKSVLREGLVSAVRTLSGGRLYCYPVTANPDGEGAWFQKTVENNRELADRLKAEYKQSLRGECETAFSPERVKLWEEWVQNTTVPLTLVDIGGRGDEKNRRICRHATHAIILYRDPNSLREWEDFCTELKLAIIARLLSDYDAPNDEINSAANPITGRLRRLERGESIHGRPEIQALAQRLIFIAEKTGICDDVTVAPNS